MRPCARLSSHMHPCARHMHPRALPRAPPCHVSFLVGHRTTFMPRARAHPLPSRRRIPHHVGHHTMFYTTPRWTPHHVDVMHEQGRALCLAVGGHHTTLDTAPRWTPHHVGHHTTFMPCHEQRVHPLPSRRRGPPLGAAPCAQCTYGPSGLHRVPCGGVPSAWAQEGPKVGSGRTEGCASRKAPQAGAGGMGRLAWAPWGTMAALRAALRPVWDGPSAWAQKEGSLR